MPAHITLLSMCRHVYNIDSTVKLATLCQAVYCLSLSLTLTLTWRVPFARNDFFLCILQKNSNEHFLSTNVFLAIKLASIICVPVFTHVHAHVCV